MNHSTVNASDSITKGKKKTKKQTEREKQDVLVVAVLCLIKETDVVDLKKGQVKWFHFDLNECGQVDNQEAFFPCSRAEQVLALEDPTLTRTSQCKNKWQGSGVTLFHLLCMKSSTPQPSVTWHFPARFLSRKCVTRWAREQQYSPTTRTAAAWFATKQI